MSAWRWLDSGPGEPAFNMALDESLLEHAAAVGTPVLRFYGWTEPAATFGYSQRYSEIAAWTPLRPLIRRTTGGGLVPHDADWTYSLVFPPTHPWHQLRAAESYRRLHEWIAMGLRGASIPAELAPSARKEIPGQCFAGAEQSDLLVNGRKIAGAAQRRSRGGLLIQGSIQPREFAVDRAEFQAALIAAADADWEELRPERSVMARAEELAATKYRQAWHNQRR